MSIPLRLPLIASSRIDTRLNCDSALSGQQGKILLPPMSFRSGDHWYIWDGIDKERSARRAVTNWTKNYRNTAFDTTGRMIPLNIPVQRTSCTAPTLGRSFADDPIGLYRSMTERSRHTIKLSLLFLTRKFLTDRRNLSGISSGTWYNLSARVHKTGTRGRNCTHMYPEKGERCEIISLV